MRLIVRWRCHIWVCGREFTSIVLLLLRVACKHNKSRDTMSAIHTLQSTYIQSAVSSAIPCCQQLAHKAGLWWWINFVTIRKDQTCEMTPTAVCELQSTTHISYRIEIKDQSVFASPELWDYSWQLQWRSVPRSAVTLECRMLSNCTVTEWCRSRKQDTWERNEREHREK